MDYDVSGGYLPTFIQHLKDTRTRLGLRTGSQENEDRISAKDATEEDIDARAHAGWTPVEHDAFFRALSVYSRWRPDLIAPCVPTKTEWEVWMYLEALQDGAATLTMEQGDEDMDMDDGLVDERRGVETQVDPGPYSHSDSDMDGDEDLCEPALEVSQAWVDAEECMASWIIDEEQLASVEEADDTPATEGVDIEPKRRRGRPLGSGKGRTRSKLRRQNVSNNGSPPPVHLSASPEPTLTRKSSQGPLTQLAREREALMGRLEVPHLLVLDSILREGEEGMKDGSKSRESSVASMGHGDGGAHPARETDVSSLSDRITGSPETSDVPEPSSNVAIDPVLLAISGGADLAGRQLNRVASESTLTTCAPVHDPAQSSSSLHTPSRLISLDVPSQPGPGNTFTFPQDDATLANPQPPDPDVNAEMELSLLSPRSRRRVQKRLYMRRRRALLRGDGAPSGGIEKLKPGKKAKPEQSETPVVSTSVPCSEVPSGAEAEFPENVPKKNKPGLTLPYKLKTQFTELGIDSAYLQDQGMSLLNLGALGRLMGLRSSLEHDEEEVDGPEIAKAIDGQLIRHLQAAMVSFVTDIIHRAIVWREREMRLKQRSRAWRHNTQITVSAVEHAVQVIGARHHSHKAYFKSLEASHGPFIEAPTEAKPLDESDDPDVAVDLSVDPPRLSLHRDVYTPLVCPPSAWKMSPLACLTRTYEREASRTRRGMSAEIKEEELMSDETDEEALEAELEEETKTDVLDVEQANLHEQGLWKVVVKKEK